MISSSDLNKLCKAIKTDAVILRHYPNFEYWLNTLLDSHESEIITYVQTKIFCVAQAIGMSYSYDEYRDPAITLLKTIRKDI